MGENNDRRVTNISHPSLTAKTGNGLTTRRTGPAMARRTNTKLRVRPMSPPKKKHVSKEVGEAGLVAGQEKEWVVDGEVETEVDAEEVEAEIVMATQRAHGSWALKDDGNCKDDVDDELMDNEDVDVASPS